MTYAVALFDDDGNKVYQPEDATRFFTDKRNIVVSIQEDGENSSIQVSLGKRCNLNAVLRLLKSLRTTAVKFNILFNVKKATKDIMPKDFANGNLLEARSLTGTKKSSYLKLDGAKMIIRHDKAVDEEKHGARGRNVRKIFIENSDGERILMPSHNLMAGRAMTRHASKGGAFNDTLGTHITNLANEQAQMRTCVGYCRDNKRKLAEDAVPVIEACKGRGKAIRDIFEGLYRRYDKESPKVAKLAEALVEEVGDDKIGLVKKKLQLEDESVIDRPTCESVARVLGESGLLGEAKKEEEMVRLPPLQCSVEKAAWDAFKADKPSIAFRNNTAPDVSPAQGLPAAALTLVANACQYDAFANMLSRVAQSLEDGKTDIILQHIAHRAVECAKNAEKIDEPKELVKTPSKSKEFMVDEEVDVAPYDTADERKSRHGGEKSWASVEERKARSEMINAEEGTPEYDAARAKWLKLRKERGLKAPGAMSESIKDGLPVVTESTKTFESWIDASIPREDYLRTIGLRATQRTPKVRITRQASSRLPRMPSSRSTPPTSSSCVVRSSATVPTSRRLRIHHRWSCAEV
jgi:hypothetical protein